MPSPTPTLRIALAGAVVAAVTACGTNAPAPGDQLEVDGESPLITDPGGVANEITEQEPGRDDPEFEEIYDD